MILKPIILKAIALNLMTILVSGVAEIADNEYEGPQYG